MIYTNTFRFFLSSFKGILFQLITLARYFCGGSSDNCILSEIEALIKRNHCTVNDMINNNGNIFFCLNFG